MKKLFKMMLGISVIGYFLGIVEWAIIIGKYVKGNITLEELGKKGVENGFMKTVVELRNDAYSEFIDT